MNQQKIVERYKARVADDMFGWEASEYLRALDFEHLKPLLKPEAQEDPKIREEWAADLTTREAVLKRMEEYMSFAFDKANNQRGLSANRSVMHYIAWIWLAGDEDFSAEIEEDLKTGYQFYGKLILRKICEKYGWDWGQWDDMTLTNG